MNEEEVNQAFVVIIIHNFSDYKVDEDLFADTVEYIIPMPAPNFYFISQIQPEQVLHRDK